MKNDFPSSWYSLCSAVILISLLFVCELLSLSDKAILIIEECNWNFENNRLFNVIRNCSVEILQENMQGSRKMVPLVPPVAGTSCQFRVLQAHSGKHWSQNFCWGSRGTWLWWRDSTSINPKFTAKIAKFFARRLRRRAFLRFSPLGSFCLQQKWTATFLKS